MVNTLFYVALIIWYIFYILFIIYLNGANNRLYDFEKEVDPRDNKRNVIDLSFIMYKKIKPDVLTASIINLINRKKIRVKYEHNDFIFIRNNDEDLTNSEFNIMELLFEIIGDKNVVSMYQINKFCDKSSGASKFLLNYQLWKRFATVESNKKFLFEEKLEYGLVKLVQRIGILLFILNIILKVNNILGFFILVPSIFVSIYFYYISKLTKDAAQEYYGWLKFRSDVKQNSQLLDNNKYLEYSVVLRCYDGLQDEKKLSFIKNLDSSIRKCHLNATLNGNRSIFGR